jgi:predicted  nucleic acid-binding Zn-ribbon protein
VKADPTVQRRLLDLARVDAELSRVGHRRRTLPELTEVAEAERTLRAKRDAMVAVETTLGDLDRDIRRQETEVEQVRAREERDRSMLDAGSAPAKQLSDLQHELGTLQRRRGALEDDLLELMERREAVEMDLQHARAQASKAEETLADAVRRRDEAVADLDSTEARRVEERQTLVPQFPDDLLNLYEKVRGQKGIGAALLRSRRCEACRLELDRSALGKVKEAPADDVVRCEECGAILVRTGESGL